MSTSPVAKSQSSKGHTHAVISPVTDAVLTGTFIIQIIFSCYAFYASTPDHTDLLFFALFCGLVLIAIKCTEIFCESVMKNIVSKRFLIGGAHNDPLSFPATFTKFSATAWQFFIHLSATIFEGWLLWDETWLSVPKTSFEPVHFVPSDALRYFYIFQTAIWIVTCFSHRFNSDAHAHKDYVLMYVHHLATIGLVSLSFHFSQHRIGIIILFIHDCSDIGVDLLKLCNYLLLEGSSGCFLTEISYAFAIIMWLALRLYYFPYHILWKGCIWAIDFGGAGGLNEYGEISPWRTLSLAEQNELYFFTRGSMILLISLFAMHIWWFFLLARILVRMLKQQDHRQIGSDEYDGDFDAKAVAKKEERTQTLAETTMPTTTPRQAVSQKQKQA